MVISLPVKRLALVLTVSLICAVWTVSPVRAADLLSLYGEENSGTSGAQFLRIPVGARSVALAKAFTSMATDGSAIYWNPAGIMRTPGRTNFFASHSKYTADIDLDYLSIHHRGQNFGYGLSLGVLRSGDILRTDEFHQQGTGQYFNANQFVIGGTLSRAMTDRFSIGGTLKFYQENLDEYQISALLADLGILYLVGWSDLRIGFAVKNFGSDLKPSGTPPAMPDGYAPSTEFQEFPAPAEGTFGAVNTWHLSRNIGLATAADFNHPSGNQESFRFGGELGLREMLYLRGGYETGREDGGWSTGFGLQFKKKTFLLRLDYAYSDMGTFGIIHHISIDLAPLTRPKSSESWRRDSR